ncbi:MAG: hypothetical protein LBR19_04390, partial [Bifidobacteriaceae bacterium]|nr:hypothetical protein [Bifidobacteriaceae bacterium]
MALPSQLTASALQPRLPGQPPVPRVPVGRQPVVGYQPQGYGPYVYQPQGYGSYGYQPGWGAPPKRRSRSLVTAALVGGLLLALGGGIVSKAVSG